MVGRPGAAVVSPRDRTRRTENPARVTISAPKRPPSAEELDNLVATLESVRRLCDDRSVWAGDEWERFLDELEELGQ